MKIGFEMDEPSKNKIKRSDRDKKWVLYYIIIALFWISQLFQNHFSLFQQKTLETWSRSMQSI